MPTRFDCFAALSRRLKAYKGLRGATIRDGSGHPKDRADPTAAECPWIRLTPSGGDWSRSHASGYETPVMVRVETATAGTDAARHFALWAEVFDCLCDWEDAGWSGESSRISSIDVLAPAEGQDPEAEADGVTYSGRGLLRINTHTEW
jgi:hypothetical protein